MEILKEFNLSYSAWNVYKQSPLQFYFQYIIKSTPSNTAFQCYGKAGNAVHDALEQYIKDKSKQFEKFWLDRNVSADLGINKKQLSMDMYNNMFENGVKYLDETIPISNTKFNTVPERKIEIELYGTTIKGYVDLEIRDGNEIYLFDWKTNSTNNYDMHKDQRLFYSWLYWKTENIIPKCDWVYLRNMSIHSDKFTEDDMIEFDNKIKYFLQDIVKKGYDIEKYDAGDWKNPFNVYYNLCAEEINNRINSDNPTITFNIKGNFVFIHGPVDKLLEDGIDFATKFDLPNKYFMQEAVKEKREKEGYMNTDTRDIGTVHLYNRNYKCFPIGLLDKVTKICNEYSDHYNKKLKIYLNDHRDKKIMEQELNNFELEEQLIGPTKLRIYQLEAIKKFKEKESGIIQIATGGGKTFTASELIRNLDAKTLWIIDRKELLTQTKEVLEKQLGVEIGVISGGVVDIKDITIATVQSLHSKLYDLIEYLYSVNFVIVDEFHKSAAETYQKVFAKLPNTKYRLGLTATPKRDDGKDPILFSILGDVIHKVSSEYLIEQGYLVKPKIIFYDTPEISTPYKTYREEYSETIAKCPHRNSQIVDIVKKNHSKKILILTKQVAHGVELKEMLVQEGLTVQHIHGSLNDKGRAKIYYDYIENEFDIMIMTISIGAEGLDIPNLDVIINAAANAGDVKSIQILGRVLRTFKNKETAQYIDFMDSGKYTAKHSVARMKALKEQGHEVNVVTLEK